MYQLTTSAAIIRTSDGACIPANLANIDYQTYLAWKALGNIPDPIPAPTKSQINAPILSQLAELDSYIPRAIEDYWISIGFDTTKLPAIQQTRLSQKISLRSQIQK
jgi:hypothetical protein